MSRSSSRDEADLPPLRQLPGPQRAAVIRDWDRRAIEECGIPGPVLMENAGAASARHVAALYRAEVPSSDRPVVILCGPGNNGGDGLVVARYLVDAGIPVDVQLPGDVKFRPGSEAAVHAAIVERLGIPLREPELAALPGAGLIVDALFGTGLTRALGSPWSDLVQAANAAGPPIVALDVPSGLHADTGEALGVAIAAQVTLTFAAPKLGLSTGNGPRHVGRVVVLDIGIPRAVLEGADLRPRDSGGIIGRERETRPHAGGAPRPKYL